MSAPLDRGAAFSGTKPVPPGLALDLTRLEAWLTPRVPGFGGPIGAAQFKGGQSNPTYALTTPTGAYVLRRKPPGTLLASAHAVEREFRVTAALHAAGFPVPEPLVLCEDAGVIGSAFYLMARVEGRVVWDPAMPGATPPERAATYDAMNATLARLHALDPAALSLSDFGRAEGYVARQVRRWSEAYRASATEDIPEMDALMAWLPEGAPSSGCTALVHGDYRLDNLILAEDGRGVRAVLDWELATLGDPVADATYHLMTWIMPRSPTGGGVGSISGLDLPALGIPGLADYAATYAARAGLPPIENLDGWLAYNLFRLAAILQGIAGRVRDGTAASGDARAVTGEVRPIARAAHDHARRAGMGAGVS